MSTVDWDFVKANLNADPMALRLKHGHEMEAAIMQIECRRKYARKFPELLCRIPEFMFPSQLAAEQASHEWVSMLHAELTASDPTPHIDMTGGLGLDFIHMAARGKDDGASALAIELDVLKADTLAGNLQLASLSKATVINDDSLQVLRGMEDCSAGLIFVDPARRGSADSRIYDPADCMPDVVGNLSEILRVGRILMVKNSPMLDIYRALHIFKPVSHIYIVSVRNECKEVLVRISPDEPFDGIDCINISDSCHRTTLHISAEEWQEFCTDRTRAVAAISYVESSRALSLDEGPLYLHEPDASVMKTGAWSILTAKFAEYSPRKLSPNCHLFVTRRPITDFPGRVICIDSIPDKRARKALKGRRINTVCRNYPQRADKLASTLQLKPGTTDYLYGATVGPEETPILLLGHQL